MLLSFICIIKYHEQICWLLYRDCFLLYGFLSNYLTLIASVVWDGFRTFTDFFFSSVFAFLSHLTDSGCYTNVNVFVLATFFGFSTLLICTWINYQKPEILLILKKWNNYVIFIHLSFVNSAGERKIKWVLFKQHFAPYIFWNI